MMVTRFYSAFTLMSLTLVAVLALPLAVNAQDSQALLDRIDRLERDIRTLNQQIAHPPVGVAPAVAPTVEAGAVETPAPAPVPTRVPAAVKPAAPQIEYTEGEGMLSRVMVRLDSLESEVRSATGQSESLSFRIDQLTQRFDKLLVDLDYRLARLEGTEPGSFNTQPTVSTVPSSPSVTKVGAMPAVGAEQGTVSKDGTYQPGAQGVGVMGSVSKSSLDAIVNKDGENMPDGAAPNAPTDMAAAPTVQAPTVQAPTVEAAVPAQPSVLPEGTVQERYRFAFNLTRQARYEEAEIAFKAFVDAHGDDALANNARYWLAETYYVRKNFMQAAQAFFESYKKAPEGSKAPDSLLKLGMSMAGLEKTTEACATFGKLRKEFTPLKANIEQALNRETKRLDCK